MAINTFIPTLWDARLLQGLQKNLVYANLMNRSYEGQISQMGDTVKINFLGDIKIGEYDADTEIDAEQLSTTDVSLIIDKSNYFNFQVDDIAKVQARSDLIGQATSNASYGLADACDIDVAKMLATTTGAYKTGLGTDATPILVSPKSTETSTGAYELLLKMKFGMDKANVSKQGRWVVVPSEFEILMLQDERFVAVAVEQAQERLVEGTVYRACGFDIYVSSNVPNTSNAKYKIISGYPSTGAYASQILNTEPYRTEKSFKDGVKGLHVYGSKVIRPSTMAIATVNFE